MKSIWKTALLGTLLMPLALWAQVNINTASVDELQTLKGIGAKKAADIIAYREANGAFKSVAELANVKGIGMTTIEKLADEIVVDDASSTVKNKSSESQSKKTPSTEKASGSKQGKAKGDAKVEKDNSAKQNGSQSSADKTQKKAQNSDKSKQ